MAKVNYKVMFERVFEILKKVARKDVNVADLPNIIKNIEKELE